MELAPKRAGFAAERLNRITDHLNRNYIEPGKITGCQTLVARHGQVAYFKSEWRKEAKHGSSLRCEIENWRD